MPIQVMADDSGTPNSEPNVVMGGLIGSAEHWIEFSDKWDACLRTPPSIPYFKMSEAASKGGCFHHMTDKQWRQRAPQFLRVLDDPAFQFTAVHITLNVADYAAWLGPRTDVMLGNASIMTKPYFYLYQLFVAAACLDLMDRGHAEPFEMFFDEQKSLGRRARLWFPLLRETLDEDSRTILPVEPDFKDDEKFLPLQAADIVAWMQRNVNSPHRKDIGWMNPLFANVRRSHYCMPFFKYVFDRMDATFKDDPKPNYSAIIDQLMRHPKP